MTEERKLEIIETFFREYKACCGFGICELVYFPKRDEYHYVVKIEREVEGDIPIFDSYKITTLEQSLAFNEDYPIKPLVSYPAPKAHSLFIPQGIYNTDIKHAIIETKTSEHYFPYPRNIADYKYFPAE